MSEKKGEWGERKRRKGGEFCCAPPETEAWLRHCCRAICTLGLYASTVENILMFVVSSFHKFILVPTVLVLLQEDRTFLFLFSFSLKK